MKLGHLELFVSDSARAKAFYTETLGFELVADQGGGMVWVKSGELEILLRPGMNESLAAEYGAAPFAFVLYCDDLTATKALLESRGVVFRGFDGSPDCPTFTDPDGHWFQLASPGAQQP